MIYRSDQIVYVCYVQSLLWKWGSCLNPYFMCDFDLCENNFPDTLMSTPRSSIMGKTEMWKNKKLLEYATEGNRIYLYWRITTRFEFFCMTDMIMEWIKYVNIHNLLYCVKKPRCSLYFVGILSRGKLPSSIFGRQNKLYKINMFLFFLN